MSENLKAFLRRVSGDALLTERLKAAADYDAIIALARELDLPLTLADIEPPSNELDEEELEAVTGGERVCGCAVGGGGVAEGDKPACACVVYGHGSDGDGGYTCICPVGGYGGWWTIGTQ